MRTQHGGKRKGAGMKTGIKKTKLKTPGERHSVKKYVSYTPEEWQRVSAKMKELGIQKYSVYARQTTLP